MKTGSECKERVQLLVTKGYLVNALKDAKQLLCTKFRAHLLFFRSLSPLSTVPLLDRFSVHIDSKKAIHAC